MTSTPNLDLLKRQRTFSIDETREQLRQGKPVQREAILTGAVDYRSLIFGDDGIAIGNSTTTGKVHHDHKPVKNLEVIAETTSTDNNDDLLGASDSVTENSINVTTEPVVSVQPPAVVEQPKQISPASWAAMLKSSANATTAIEVKKPIGAAKSIPQKAKTVANDSSKKSQPSGDKVNGSSSSKDEKKSDSKKKKTNNSKNGEKLASPQQKSRVQQLDEIVKKGEEVLNFNGVCMTHSIHFSGSFKCCEHTIYVQLFEG